MKLSKLQIMKMNKNWRNFRLEDVENIDEKSKASKEAEEQGLVHLGFGRYGPNKGDSATHVSMGGALKKLSGKKKSKKSDDKPQMGLKPFKTKATKIGGGTGVDADFLGEPPEGSREPDDTAGDPEDAWDDEEGRAKPTGKTDADIDDYDYDMGEPGDKPFGGDTGKDADYDYETGEFTGDDEFALSGTDTDDPAGGRGDAWMHGDEEPKEKRPGGKQAEDDYQKADQMMKKYAGVDIEKAEYWAKKKKQAADSMMGRTGKELDEKWMKEIMRVSNIKCV